MKMEIKYLRNLNKSYMVLGPNGTRDGWEQEMLMHNRPEEIIAPNYTEEDGTDQLWYDITGKQALDVVLAGRELDGELLRELCSAILSAARILEKLLLNPDDMLLTPECIFLDNLTDKINFCYYPGNGQSLLKSFHEFMEFVLAKLNHKDAWAVEISYQLYEQTKVEGYCMADVSHVFEQTHRQDEVESEPAILCENHRSNLDDCDMSDSEERSSWRQFVKAFLSKIILQMQKKKERKKELFVFEPEEDTEKKQMHPTVLLSDLKKGSNIIQEEAESEEGILKYEGDGDGYDLKVDHNPYIIGSDSLCDGIIHSDTVSRRHAKITKKENIYFIEDLNSSNGTFVGGELLNCRIKMSLQRNETIVFADKKFRFI